MNFKPFVAALAVATLAACGGGGSSSPTPAKAHGHVVFAATSVGGASTTSKLRRSTESATCSSLPSSLAIQAIPQTEPTSNYSWFQSFVAATEYDANCDVISSSPSYTVSSTTLISLTAPAWLSGIDLATPAPGGTALVGGTPGAATVTATFPDGTSASAPVSVYATGGVSCDGDAIFDGTTTWEASRAWSATLGAVGPNGPYCDGSTGTSPQSDDMQAGYNNVSFPYGYQVVMTAAAGTYTGALFASALLSITNCSSFASQGTSLSASDFATTGGIQVILFKTSTGACVKFAPQIQQQGYIGVDFVGWYAVSDSSGNFAY